MFGYAFLEWLIGSIMYLGGKSTVGSWKVEKTSLGLKASRYDATSYVEKASLENQTIYLGAKGVVGSWQILDTGTTMTIARYDVNSYVTKLTIPAA